MVCNALLFSFAIASANALEDTDQASLIQHRHHKITKHGDVPDFVEIEPEEYSPKGHMCAGAQLNRRTKMDEAACRALCLSTEGCAYITHFDDGVCEAYSSCDQLLPVPSDWEYGRVLKFYPDQASLLQSNDPNVNHNVDHNDNQNDDHYQGQHDVKTDELQNIHNDVDHNDGPNLNLLASKDGEQASHNSSSGCGKCPPEGPLYKDGSDLDEVEADTYGVTEFCRAFRLLSYSESWPWNGKEPMCSRKCIPIKKKDGRWQQPRTQDWYWCHSGTCNYWWC